MRKWILACAVVTVGCFLAEPVAPAQEVVQAQGTVITSSQPRMGLFRRIRDRREMRTVEPVTMRTTTLSSTTPSTIVQSQATTPSTTTPSATTPSTTPSTTMATLPTTQAQPRQGLLARLRARR